MKFWVENSLRWLNIGLQFSGLQSFLRDLLLVWWLPFLGDPIFFSVALKIFSLISILVNLTIICLGFALLEEYFCAVLCVSWIWMLAFLARLGKLSWIMSWRVFSNLVPFSLSHSGTPIKHRFGLFTESHISWRLCSFLFFLSNLVFRLYFIKLIFNL